MHLNPLTPKLDLFLQIFLTECHSRNLRPRTIEYYKTQLNWFLAYATASGCESVDDITPYIIRAYLHYLKTEREWAGASVHTAARAIRALFNFLQADGIITESPMKRVKMPKNEQPEKLPFTGEELKRIIAAANTQRDKTIVYCLLDSGCRVGEFTAWTYGDIDFRTGAIHLSAADTKGRRSRVVYLGTKARHELLKLLTTFNSVNAQTPLWQSDKTGNRLTAEGIKELLKRLGRRANVSPIGAHRFRRTFAVNYLRNGGDLFSLQNLLGHTDLTMVRRYVTLVDSDLHAAHKKFSPADNL